MSPDTVFQIYVVCASILVFNLLFLASGTAIVRAKNKKIVTPEDVKLNAEAEVQENAEGDIARWKRAHLNAMENILPFLPIGLLLAMARPSVAVAGALFGSFTLFRLLHSLFYIKAIQPWRTASFGIAAISLAAMTVVLLVKVLTA